MIEQKISRIDRAELPELVRLLASYESEEPDFVRNRARFMASKLQVYVDMLRAFDRGDADGVRVTTRDGTFSFSEDVLRALSRVSTEDIKRLISRILSEEHDAAGDGQKSYAQDPRRTINVRERTILELLASDDREFSLTEIVGELASKNLAKTSQAVTAHLHRMQGRDLLRLVRKGTWKITESGRSYLAAGHLRLIK